MGGDKIVNISGEEYSSLDPSDVADYLKGCRLSDYRERGEEDLNVVLVYGSDEVLGWWIQDGQEALYDVEFRDGELGLLALPVRHVGEFIRKGHENMGRL